MRGTDFLYRQQFLCDKYELPFPSGDAPSTKRAVDAEAEEIPIADIIEEETQNDDASPREG